MGVLLHLVQRGKAWAGWGSAQSPLRCTKCNSTPINGQSNQLHIIRCGILVCLHSKGLILKVITLQERFSVAEMSLEGCSRSTTTTWFDSRYTTFYQWSTVICSSCIVAQISVENREFLCLTCNLTPQFMVALSDFLTGFKQLCRS